MSSTAKSLPADGGASGDWLQTPFEMPLPFIGKALTVTVDSTIPMARSSSPTTVSSLRTGSSSRPTAGRSTWAF